MIDEVFAGKSSKPKEKVRALATAVIEKKITVSELLKYCEQKKEPIIASCIEALEFVGREAPALITTEVIVAASTYLKAKAPRIKWESAKVLGNAAAGHVKEYEKAIPTLIELTEFEGTVVRWSAAYAIAEIIKQQSKWRDELIQLSKHLAEHEEKASISKIYKEALKEIQKRK